MGALVLLFALLRCTPCSRRSGLGTQNSAINRKNNSRSLYFGALQPQILLPAGPPKPDGSDTKYSVQRDCINPNATEPAFQKKKDYFLLYWKAKPVFHGSVSPALCFTPLHSVFAPIRFRNKRGCRDLKNLSFKINFSSSASCSLKYCYQPGHLNPMEATRSIAYSGIALTQMPLNLLSKKRKIIFFLYWKAKPVFHGSVSPALRFTPLHSVFAPIRFRNKKEYFEVQKPHFILTKTFPK